MALERSDGSAIASAPAPFGWRFIAAFTDIVTALLLLVALAAIISATGGRVLLALPFGALGAAAIRLPHGAYLVGLVDFGVFPLVAWWVVRKRLSLEVAALVVYAAVLAIELSRAQHDFSSFNLVTLRTGGNDWLTYESQAHAVLAGSLRGAEGVFAYSPAFRYMLAIGHLLFGNGDARVSLVVLAAMEILVLLFGLLVIVRWNPTLRRQTAWRDIGRRPSIALGGTVLAVLGCTLLVSGQEVVSFVRDPLSEPATWILIPGACILLLLVRRRWAFVGASALCGLAFITRADQGIGLVALMGCGAVALIQSERAMGRPWRSFRWPAIAALGAFVGVALLPALHNLVYGGKPQLLVNTPHIPQVYPFTLSDVPRLCCNSAVQTAFLRQLRRLTVVGAGSGAAFTIISHLIQIVWLGAVIVVIGNWRRTDVLGRVVAFLPLAFMVPQLFLEVNVYYPRHVIADYLVMGLSSAYVLGDFWMHLSPPLQSARSRTMTARSSGDSAPMAASTSPTVA
jgi:hypothetical protein